MKAAVEKMKAAQHETWREKQVTRRLLQEKDDEVLGLLAISQQEMDLSIAEAEINFKAQATEADRCRDQLLQERQHFWKKALKSREIQAAKLGRDQKEFAAMKDHLQTKHRKEIAQLNADIEERENMQTKCRSAAQKEKEKRRATEQCLVEQRKKMKLMKLRVEDTEHELQVCDESCVAMHTNPHAYSSRGMEPTFFSQLHRWLRFLQR